MTIQEFNKFIEEENERLNMCYEYSDNEKRILAGMVKLTEEVGELADEVLAHSSLQRKEKAGHRGASHLAEEFADVIIVTFLLAKAMNVDIGKALKKKTKKIEKRHGLK